VPEGEIAVDDPRAGDVRELLATHLAFARGASPPEAAFALDVDGLLDPAVTLFSFRADGKLLGIGALMDHNEQACELKSMHTAEVARGQGVGRAMLTHLLDVARARGYRTVSLETGSMAEFAPARALYHGAGFRNCGPFGGYPPSPYSTFMSLELGG
jgi:putative acetyltransferase